MGSPACERSICSLQSAWTGVRHRGSSVITDVILTVYCLYLQRGKCQEFLFLLFMAVSVSPHPHLPVPRAQPGAQKVLNRC